MKIAGTTGYTRPMLDSLQALAAKQGYLTDRSLAALTSVVPVLALLQQHQRAMTVGLMRPAEEQ